jgi:hypothetical protein
MLPRLPFVLAALLVGVDATWQYFDNTNTVDGCGEACTNNGPYRCLGTVSSFPACQQKCAGVGEPACVVVAWSSTTGNCWTRTDGDWTPTSAPGVSSGCDDAAAHGCSAPWNGSAVTAIVTLAMPPGAVVTHPLSPAVTLDFWRPDDPTYGIKWGSSGAQNINLTHPALLALTAALAPALLRLGGSPEDSLIYDSDGTCVPQSGGDGPFPGYYCSQVHPYSYECLTPARWQELLAFGSATGVQITIGLNGCWGRPSKNESMDVSNALALIHDTATSPHAKVLWGFELSNEVVPNTITPYIYDQDMATIAASAKAAFAAAGLPAPGFAGPDQGGPSTIAAVAANSAANVFTAFSYHQYPECTAPSTPGTVFPVACLYGLDTAAASYAAAVAANAHSPAGVWAGETADHSGGGVLNLTDTFRSSFYYAWQLGALPLNGVELAARQCLSGGDYELLQRTTFVPNPDFYLVWLFKNLIGGAATPFAVNLTVPFLESGVRVFAFSPNPQVGAGTKATLLILNLADGSPGHNTPVALTLQGAGVAGQPRVEYHMTAPLGVGSEHGPVAVNGMQLSIDPATNLPPAWQDLGRPGDAGDVITLQPASIVFVTIG